ncbi:MAG: peptidase M20 [Gammaproteobacteria bacterium SG8_30]|nr:MAG: peptidase M20 [Gammaproteobacteria bacterium SG8_30]
MDMRRAQSSIDGWWTESIVPHLCEYVRIPNKSPMFDAGWEAHGHMDRAAELLAGWCRRQPLTGMSVEIVRLPGRTPVLLCEVPGTAPGTVLLYGHMDKQPEFTGWSEGLSPWEPVIRDGRLYGRGGADDGYAVFASLAAIRALQEQDLPHARCVVLIEGCEESGSADLPHYVEALSDRIGSPDLVVCLDAECGNYEQLWCTTSLRGAVLGTLSVEVLTEGVHSGAGTGVAPSPFRILRSLLSRIESEVNGDLMLDALYCPIPKRRMEQAAAAAEVLGETVYRKMPFLPGVEPLSDSPYELLLNNTWRPSLTVTGADGLPAVRDAGNTLLPQLALKLSIRLAPKADPGAAAKAVKDALESDPPYGARVRFDLSMASAGWNAPQLEPWLTESMQRASQAAFGRDVMYLGTGGGIPFIGMLAERYPGVQFLVTGVLGPSSNAHGPNEFLHIAYARRLTLCVASVLADHAGAARRREAA